MAQEREISLAEVLRRGVEYITRVYPPLPANAGQEWQLPGPVRLGLRPGVTLERLRDYATDEVAVPGTPAYPA